MKMWKIFILKPSDPPNFKVFFRKNFNNLYSREGTIDIYFSKKKNEPLSDKPQVKFGSSVLSHVY